MSELCVGVLALQGAFREHVAAVTRLGATAREVRQLKDIDGIDALIIPGGESTTMGKLLNEWNMLEPLRQRILDGLGHAVAEFLLASRQRGDAAFAGGEIAGRQVEQGVHQAVLL